MLYREAAVRISQTVLLLSRELSVSADQMFEYQQEAKSRKSRLRHICIKSRLFSTCSSPKSWIPS